MKVNDVIKQVATYLQLANVMSADLTSESLDSQTQKDVNLILSSVNEVLSEIATEYLPLIANEEVTIQNGEFDLTTLSKPFHKLVKVRTTKKYAVDFETLKIENGTYKLEYCFLPEIAEIGDDIVGFDTKLTTYSLSFGVAAEFCMISGNYSEAEMWSSKFENAMQAISKPHKTFMLKKRRWL